MFYYTQFADHTIFKFLHRSIVDSLNYYPEDKKLFSVTGCKRIAQRVGIYIANERFSREFDDEGKDEL